MSVTLRFQAVYILLPLAGQLQHIIRIHGISRLFGHDYENLFC